MQRRSFWQVDPVEADRQTLKRMLRDRSDVRVYTPASREGEGLDLPVSRPASANLAGSERGILARSAAAALGAIDGLRKAQSDQTRARDSWKRPSNSYGRVPVSQLARHPDLGLIARSETPTLVAAVGKLDTSTFARCRKSRNASPAHESPPSSRQLAVVTRAIFRKRGIGEAATSTPLSIVSTKFIGDNASYRTSGLPAFGPACPWASRNSAGSLQAVGFFGRGDIYLPAQSKARYQRAACSTS